MRSRPHTEPVFDADHPDNFMAFDVLNLYYFCSCETETCVVSDDDITGM